jgi:hypothetical protein
MDIDYQALVPMALKAMYRDEREREGVERQLQAYGTESFHREQSRVQLGVLYLASKAPEKLASLIDIACADWRDLLCAAEYPHSSRRWGLKDKDPEKYKKLQDREEKEYLAWVESIKLA